MLMIRIRQNLEVFSTMFPKLLRVAASYGRKSKVWINETYFMEKVVLPYRVRLQLDAISRALGFSYEVKLPSHMGVFGEHLANGTWSGVFGMLQQGEVDMVIGDFPINEELCDEFRTSYPNTIWESTFMTRNPAPVPNMATFLHPFSIQVWFAILAFVSPLSLIFHYLLRKKNSAPNLLTSILGSLVGQAMILTPRRPREYLVLASWILGSAFLYRFYAAVLLSFVTIPPLKGIRTIEDLANGIKSGKYECATFPNTNVYSLTFIATEVPALEVIGYNLKNRENNSVVEYLEESCVEKKTAFVYLRPFFLPYKDYYYVPEDNFLFLSLAFLTRKDFCCGLELDKAVHRVWASGIFKKIDDDLFYSFFLKDSKKYSKNWNDSSSETQLTMTMLKGPFIFLIASHSLAFLVFLIEVCIGRFQKR